MNDAEVIEFNDILLSLQKSVSKTHRKKLDQLVSMFSTINESAQQKIIKRKYTDLQYSFRSFNPLRETARSINCLSNASAMYEEAKRDLDTADKASQDLLHAIELLEFEDAEKSKLYEELKEIRRFRRICKQFIELTEPLNHLANKYKNFLTELCIVHNRIKEIQKDLDTRQYYPRIRKDLEEAFNVAGSVERTASVCPQGNEN